ncbi:MAG: mechanosensitive ion channel family protein [archaeon]
MVLEFLGLEFLQKSIYGITIEGAVLFVASVIIAFVIGKLVYYAFKTVGRQVTERTKNKLDDLLIDALEEPIVGFLVIAGLFFGFQFLHLTNQLVNDVFVKLLMVLVLANVVWLLIRLVDVIIEGYLKPLAEKTNSKVDDQILPVVGKSAKLALITLGGIIVLSTFGFDVTALIAGVGVGGLAFAFAAKETISDVFGGVSLFASKPFVVGDRVKMQGFDGFITEIGLRNTRMKNFEGRIITIPNSKVAGNPIENVSIEPTRRVKIELGLTYNTKTKKLEEAKKVIAKTLDKTKDVSKTHLINFTEFGDSALKIMVIYYITNNNEILGTMDKVNFGIKEGLEKAGIEIAFPTQTIYVKK